jgi:hypothetical protein
MNQHAFGKLHLVLRVFLEEHGPSISLRPGSFVSPILVVVVSNTMSVVPYTTFVQAAVQAQIPAG